LQVFVGLFFEQPSIKPLANDSFVGELADALPIRAAKAIKVIPIEKAILFGSRLFKFD
tara:strand:+ start:1178 stop:1351 length:174 start_codon:yes stop_codon:yes gene_type:complete